MTTVTRACLAQLADGERGAVFTIEGAHSSVSRLTALGFSIGADVQMLRNGRHGPLLVRVRNTQVALGREIAAGILMEGPSDGMPRPGR